MHATPGTATVEDDCLRAEADDAEARVRADYAEMPGLRLTEAQARRLWNLETGVCRLVLLRLRAAGLLRQLRDGSFIRADVY